jgi:hypothetical protein
MKSAAIRAAELNILHLQNNIRKPGTAMLELGSDFPGYWTLHQILTSITIQCLNELFDGDQKAQLAWLERQRWRLREQLTTPAEPWSFTGM